MYLAGIRDALDIISCAQAEFLRPRIYEAWHAEHVLRTFPRNAVCFFLRLPQLQHFPQLRIVLSLPGKPPNGPHAFCNICKPHSKIAECVVHCQLCHIATHIASQKIVGQLLSGMAGPEADTQVLVHFSPSNFSFSNGRSKFLKITPLLFKTTAHRLLAQPSRICAGALSSAFLRHLHLS